MKVSIFVKIILKFLHGIQTFKSLEYKASATKMRLIFRRYAMCRYGFAFLKDIIKYTQYEYSKSKYFSIKPLPNIWKSKVLRIIKQNIYKKIKNILRKK